MWKDCSVTKVRRFFALSLRESVCEKKDFLVATLGLSVVNGKEALTKEAKYGLVWEVTPANRSYPVCFVDAMTGKLIYYFNGIIW